MAITYTWQNLSDVVQKLVKGVGNYSSIIVQVCDFTSSDMYIDYPWKDTITNTANGTIALTDSKQDYSMNAPNISRLLKAWIVRTDVTPNETRDLDVQKDLSVDLYPRSYLAIRAVSMQQSIGLFRLESAVNVPSGVQIELRCDYQLEPTKVAALSQTCWFRDKYAPVAVEGILYWAYKLADDQRAGTTQTDAFGRIIGYSGQLANFKGALTRMKMAEDYGFTESVFPADPMGLGRDCNSLNIFGS